MNRTTLIRNAVTVLTVVGVGTALPVAASASTTTASPAPTPGSSTTLATLKAHCNDGVQKRLGTLSADNSFVSASTTILTASDRSALQSQIQADETGLTALDATIQADTTVQQARADCQQIVDGYHVYVMEDPKIHLVIAADTISSVNSLFAQMEPQLQKEIDASTSPHKADAQTALNDLESKVTASQTSDSGVSASIINLTASGYPGNKVDLQSAQANLHTARTDLEGARTDLHTVLKDLG